MKNFDNLEKAQFMVDNHYKRFSKELSTSGERKRSCLETEFDKTFSELKVAQANITKSIAEYKKLQENKVEQDKIKEDVLDLRMNCVSNEIKAEALELTDTEMDEIVFSLHDDLDF